MLSPEVRAIGIGGGRAGGGGDRALDLRAQPRVAQRARSPTICGTPSRPAGVRRQRQQRRRRGASTATARAAATARCCFVGVGTGIGGGIVVDGRLLRGAHGFAAEIGHIVWSPVGRCAAAGTAGAGNSSPPGTRSPARAAPPRETAPAVDDRAPSGGHPGQVTGPAGHRGGARRRPRRRRASSPEVGRRLGEGIARSGERPRPRDRRGGRRRRRGRRPAPRSGARWRSARPVEAAEHRPEVPLVVAALGNDCRRRGRRRAGAGGARLKLGVSLPVFTVRPGPAARGRGEGRGARLRRRLLAGPLLPAGLLSAVGPRPAGAGAVHPAGGRLRAAPRSGGRDARRSGHASRAAACWRSRPRRSTTMSGGRAILALGTGDGASKPEHDMYGFPFPSATERIALLEETVRRAPRAVRRRARGRAAPTCPRSPARCCPPGSPALWVGGRSDAVLGVAARVADAWNGWGVDVRGVRGEGGACCASSRTAAPSRRRGAASRSWGRTAEDLERLLADRAAKGLSPDGVWTGTAAELRSLRRRARRGRRDVVRRAAGGADRPPGRHRARR